ncbi:MAG: winged helix-turn-helix domain-containing protein [Cellvibrio sp.]|uniref:winged helix-turn-helix domain-containing protein n=1 Tax=Cellvibrio sp. TaxID=1965322 RepID=UPI0031B52A2E
MPNETLIGDSSTTIACITIKTGQPGCRAFFYPSIYKLLVVDESRKQKFDLGYAGSRLLERLLEFAGDAVGREDLIAYAWPERVVGQGSLNQQIYTLRQILGDEKARKIIQTLPRRGYLFHPDFVSRSADTVPAELFVAEVVATDVQSAVIEDDQPAAFSSNISPTKSVTEQDSAAPELTTANVSAEPAINYAAAAVIHTPTHKPFNWPLMLAGVLALGLGVGTYLFYPKRAGVDVPVHEQINVGELGIVYAGDNPERLENLKARTHKLTMRLVKVSNVPGTIFWRVAGTYYEALCVSNNAIGKALTVHEDQLETITEEQLRACFPD